MVKKDTSFKLYLSVVLLTIIVSVIVEINATTNYLAVFGGVLILEICFFNYYLNRRKFISPLLIFSIMYSGYAIGAYYYATSNGYFGKFIEFLNLSRSESEYYIIISILYASLCYLLFCIGYLIFNESERKYIPFKMTGFLIFIRKYYRLMSFPLLAIGLSWWYYVSITIAGSIINSFIYFQLFPHFIEEHGLSIAPYLLYYAGIQIWLFGLIISKKKINIIFIIFALLGFAIALSTARITIAVTYLLVMLMFVYLIAEEYRKKIIIIISLILSSAFVFFFLREISNHYYLTSSVDGENINLLQSIIGGGNVADLQQLMIVFKTFHSSNILLGSSYFDWFTNSFSEYFGIPPSSIGLIVYNLYVPSGSSSGAPTPGAIGEAFANFYILAPLFMFYVGMFISYIRKISENSNNFLIIYMYSSFLVCFVFMYPKVDSTMIVNFFWSVFPTLLVLLIYYLIFIATKLIIKGRKSNYAY